MKDYSPIKVVVPQPWRTLGRLFAFLFALSLIGAFWQLFISAEQPAEDMVAVGYLGFFIAPFFFLLLLPVFLNCYPSWVIRLVGRKYVLKLIDDCKRYAGRNRDIKAELLQPQNWFKDQRFFWIVMIIGCGVLGLLQGAGLL